MVTTAGPSPSSRPTPTTTAQNVSCWPPNAANAWQRVDALIRTTKPKEYDQAITLLIDLRDLDQREDRPAEFEQRVQHIRDTYPNRPASCNAWTGPS
jgi:hypothetical protein